MNKNIVKLLLICVFGLLLVGAFYYFRPLISGSTRLTVTGESTADLSPDNAVVTFSVVTQNAQVLNAQNQNSKRVEAILKALADAAGGGNQKTETTGYSLTPQNDYSDGKEKIVGYEARNSITVTTDKLDQLGALIDAGTKAGANQVDGINFILREDSTKRGEALGRATSQAMVKAEAVAKSLGGKIVRVVETVEGGSTPTPVAAPYAYAANTNALSTQIRPSSVSVHGQVTLVVEVAVPR